VGSWGLAGLVPAGIGLGAKSSHHHSIGEGGRLGFGGQVDVVATERERRRAPSGGGRCLLIGRSCYAGEVLTMENGTMADRKSLALKMVGRSHVRVSWSAVESKLESIRSSAENS